ncbi:hypothetical protein Rcae01_00309 [Novipirellula caenicola]|uniref:Integral membrane protein n=1 Tax=Novipirellula caenicola TaxID=1536901 RepID=A0ABP9VI29_9BACT
MRFTTLTIFLFVTVFATSFAAIKTPSQIALEIGHMLHLLSACAALVVAFHSSGRVQSYSLTYGIFSFGTMLIRGFPNSISMWIWENVTHDGPDSLPTGNGDHFLVEGIIQTAFGILVALFAASLVASLRNPENRAS